MASSAGIVPEATHGRRCPRERQRKPGRGTDAGIADGKLRVLGKGQRLYYQQDGQDGKPRSQPSLCSGESRREAWVKERDYTGFTGPRFQRLAEGENPTQLRQRSRVRRRCQLIEYVGRTCLIQFRKSLTRPG